MISKLSTVKRLSTFDVVRERALFWDTMLDVASRMGLQRGINLQAQSKPSLCGL